MADLTDTRSELGRIYLLLLSKPDGIKVPTIVQFEIYKWLVREQSSEVANRAITFTSECIVEDLTTAVAVLASEFSATHKLHTSDAVIFATSQMHDAPLITCDAQFKGLQGVEYFEKKIWRLP